MLGALSGSPSLGRHVTPALLLHTRLQRRSRASASAQRRAAPRRGSPRWRQTARLSNSAGRQQRTCGTVTRHSQVVGAHPSAPRLAGWTECSASHLHGRYSGPGELSDEAEFGDQRLKDSVMVKAARPPHGTGATTRSGCPPRALDYDDFGASAPGRTARQTVPRRGRVGRASVRRHRRPWS